jgi:hypothetical protein
MAENSTNSRFATNSHFPHFAWIPSPGTEFYVLSCRSALFPEFVLFQEFAPSGISPKRVKKGEFRHAITESKWFYQSSV